LCCRLRPDVTAGKSQTKHGCKYREKCFIHLSPSIQTLRSKMLEFILRNRRESSIISHYFLKTEESMAKRLFVLIALVALTANVAAAQVGVDAKAVVQTAAKAMGVGNLKSIQYSGTGGWFGAFGQSFAPGENWPRTDIVSYTRTIDYEKRTSREEYTR